MANEFNVIIDGNDDGLRRAIDSATRQLNQFEQRINQIGDLGDKLTRLGTAMTVGLTVPIVALGKSALEAYADIQSLQLGLEAVLGSAERAGAEFERLKIVAKLPGLGLQEAVKGSINLQSIGFSAKNARNILLQFGNAVATVGKGRVEFERAIYGVQQLANTDFPLGEDLNIIKDAVPQVSRLLKEAFGTSRSDEIAKLGKTSQDVLKVILDGLGKLPRVTGGIKGAFENLSDNIKTSLGRIGKIIDDNFDISGIIDKLTSYLDRAISAFEGLDPFVQKVILSFAGLLAVTGPLLVAIGGFMALLPTITAGLSAVGAAFGFLLSPIGLVTAALIGVVAAVVANWDKIRPYIEENIDRFKRLYNESTIFRIAIGSLGATFESSLKIGFEALKLFYNNFKAFGKAILNIFSGVGDVIEGALTFDPQKIKAGLFKSTSALAVGINDLTSNTVKSGSKIIDIFNETSNKWMDLRFDLSKKTNLGLKGLGEDPGVDTLIAGLGKTKKERERQIAELIPAGSIADYQKRADLLKKSIEYSVDGLVKVRGLDKFGKDIDKNGNPYYTGLVLPIEKAYEELEKLQVAGGQIDLQPIKVNSKGFLDPLGNEFKTLGDFLQDQATRLYDITNTQIPKTIADGAVAAAVAAAKWEEAKINLNETLTKLIDDSISSGLTDVFASIGESIANGGNVLANAGQAIIGIIGNFLQNFGQELIKTALLSEVFAGLIIAIKNAFANPYVLLALGAAAVVLGAVLTGAAKRTSATAGGGGASGTSGATGGSASTSYSSNYSNAAGNGGGEVIFRISGPDLVGAFNRSVAAQDRVNAI